MDTNADTVIPVVSVVAPVQAAPVSVPAAQPAVVSPRVKIFNTHRSNTEAVAIINRDGKPDFVTILPKAAVKLHAGAKIAPTPGPMKKHLRVKEIA